MKRVIASFLTCLILLSGCTGSFELMKKVNSFHRRQEDKWVDQLVFVGCLWLPVYGLAALGDILVINVIEFWEDENPLTDYELTRKVIKKEDKKAVLTKMNDKEIKIESEGNTFVLERGKNGLTVKDINGSKLYFTVGNDNGEVEVYNGGGKLIKVFADEDKALLGL